SVTRRHVTGPCEHPVSDVSVSARIRQMNRFRSIMKRYKELMEGPVEGPELKLQGTFSFSRYKFFYYSCFIEDNKDVITFDVGTREDEHRPRFHIIVKVMKDFSTTCFDDTVWGAQHSSNVCSCANAFLNGCDVTLT